MPDRHDPETLGMERMRCPRCGRCGWFDGVPECEWCGWKAGEPTGEKKH
jgi:uncharacterized protein (DUF983 family)